MSYDLLKLSRSFLNVIWSSISISQYYFIVEKVPWISRAGSQLWAVSGSYRFYLTEGARERPGSPAAVRWASLPPPAPEGLLHPCWQGCPWPALAVGFRFSDLPVQTRSEPYTFLSQKRQQQWMEQKCIYLPLPEEDLLEELDHTGAWSVFLINSLHCPHWSVSEPTWIPWQRSENNELVCGDEVPVAPLGSRSACWVCGLSCYTGTCTEKASDLV